MLINVCGLQIFEIQMNFDQNWGAEMPQILASKSRTILFVVYCCDEDVHSLGAKWMITIIIIMTKH